MPATRDRRLGGIGLVAALTALCALSLAACSKKETAAPRRAEKPVTTPVVNAAWGSGDGQIGRDVPEQGLPEGPKTLVVEANGLIHVLDGVNDRIVSFSNGASAGSIKLPARSFEDLELDGAGGFVLLDAHQTPALVFVGGDGQVKSEVPLASADIEEPSLVTAIVRGTDGWYVEVEDDYLVRVADRKGAPLPHEVLGGQALADVPGAVFKVDMEEPTLLSLMRVDPGDEGDTVDLSEIKFGDRVAERTLFTQTPTGFLLAVRLEAEQSDPEKPPFESHSLAVLATNGSVVKRLALPNAGGVEDMFRPVRRGEDGNVYVMAATQNGVEIGKVTP
jgi:hypothetical protein